MISELVLVYACWAGVAVCALGPLYFVGALFFDLEGVIKSEACFSDGA